MLVTPQIAAQMIDQLRARGQALATIREKIEKALAVRRGQLEKERKEALATAPGSEPMAPAVRREIQRRLTASATRELAALRKRHVEETAAERAAILELLDRYTVDLDQTEPLVNPVAVLARSGLGSERRTHLQAQLQGAGPAGLRNHAAEAIAAGDRELGAAVLATAAADPKRYGKQTIDHHALAEALVGAESKALQRQLAEARLLVDELRVIDSAIRTGAVSATAKIRVALAKHALDPAPDDRVPVDDVSGTGRIRRGLADRTGKEKAGAGAA